MEDDVGEFISKRTKYQGYLRKWTNYVKNYQKRWFVYEKGFLSYYRSPSEVGKSCRGQINLCEGKLRSNGNLSFTVYYKNDIAYVLKAETKKEYDIWMDVIGNALKECALGSTDKCVSDTSFKTVGSNEEFDSRLEKFLTHATVAKESCLQLTVFASEVYDTFKHASQELNLNREVKLRDIYKQMNDTLQTFNDLNFKVKTVIQDLARATDLLAESATLSRLKPKSTNSTDLQSPMKNSTTGEVIITAPSDDNLIHNDSIVSNPDYKKIANINESNIQTSSEDEFYDAVEEPEATPNNKLKDELESDKNHLSSNNNRLSQRNNSISLDPVNPVSFTHCRSFSDMTKPEEKNKSHQHRTSIPPRPDTKMSLWSIVKNLIGKDLSKVPLPVNFNEPISMLQRVTETLEYSELFDKAARCDDPLLQMCYVVAFCVSTYASTLYRTGKPFNPILGETYELDRTKDLGWRAISEQVSHHPPVSVLYTEGKGWVLWETFNVKSKFRAKYLQIDPIGLSQCIFKRSGFHYSWNKVTVTVNNIVLGTLWIDQSGTLEVTNHTTGDKCSLEFTPYSYIKKGQPRKVSGVVKDRDGNSRYILNGYWDKILECSKVVNNTSASAEGVNDFTTFSTQLLWRANVLPKAAAAMYYFSEFTCSLNEIALNIAPTDSRFRPDQRVMEEGDFNKANIIKQSLEEAQRARRKKELDAAKASGKAQQNTTHEEIYKPLWFEMDVDSNLNTGAPLYKYKGGYWEAKEQQNWEICPRLFDGDQS